MGLLQTIGFKGSSTHQHSIELPNIYPFPWLQSDFISTDVENIYSRILTDVIERTEGIKDDLQFLLWDNCLASENSEGLVTMLSKAMAGKTDLYIVYKKEFKLIRKANSQEQTQIAADYKDRGESKVGIYVTFKNYKRTDMIKLYSGLEFCTVGSLYKSMNLSQAIQLKIKMLRETVGGVDAEIAITQGKAIAEGLKNGKDVMIDGEDTIETAKPELTAAQASIDFIAKKMSNYLGLPASWIIGEASKGLGDSGDGDEKKVESGLRVYFASIIKPTVDKLFGVSTSFKSSDDDGLTGALALLKDFELTSEQFISAENKQKIINRKFNLPPDAKGDPLPEPKTPVTTEPTNVVPQV